MKTIEIINQLRAKAADGDAMAMAALLISYRLSEIDDRLTAIDGVLTEIRNTLQQEQ